jgi:hypothetical protein
MLVETDSNGRTVWGVSLLPRGFESRRKHGCLSLKNVVCYVGRRPCDRLLTRPEVSYRVYCVWMWSWSIDNKEVLDH